MKDNECKAYLHTDKCQESSCEGCQYRMDVKMTVCQFINLIYNKSQITFYLNNKLVDIDELFDNGSIIVGFEFEDASVVRIYI